MGFRVVGLAAASAALGCTGVVGEAVPEGAVALDAAPGDEVAIDGVRLFAPTAGHGVWSEVVFDDGFTRGAAVETLLDGRVIAWLDEPLDEPLDEEVEAEEAGEAAAAGSPGPCNDKAKNLQPWTWTTPYRWTFKAGSTPSNVSRAAAETRMKRAATNITRSDNSCGMADRVAAKHGYLGRAPRAAQIDAAGACGSQRDEHNAVSFGNLPAGVLGVACVWFSGGEALEGDVKLNKADHAWIANIGSGCSGRFSIEAVMTHELGHVFGLAHVSEASHGNLTMSTAINGPCQNAEGTLGRGDVIGLRAKY